MLKKDLFEKVGEVSEDKLYEIIALEADLIGLDLDGQTDNDEE